MNATPDPHWTAYLTALLTPSIAIGAVIVGWMQWIIARKKLRLDLFQRRLVVYEGAWRLAMGITVTGRVTEEELREFCRSTAEGRWLFSGAAEKCLTSMFDKASNLFDYQKIIGGGLPEGERAEFIAWSAEIKLWMEAQLPALEKIFAPELRLGAGIDQFWHWPR